MSSHQFWDSAQQMATPEFVLSGVCHMKRAEKPARGKSNIKALVELSGSNPGFLSVTYRPVSLAKLRPLRLHFLSAKEIIGLITLPAQKSHDFLLV